MENKMKDMLLPIGSVVLLEGGTRKTVIMGVLQFDAKNQEKIYDYLGVPYPEGYLGPGSTYLFNHEHITEVYQRGYEDDERERFMQAVEQVYKTVDEAVEGQENK